MKLREFMASFFTRVKDGISRYLIAFACSVLLFAVGSFEILFETGEDKIIWSLIGAFAFTGVFSVLLKSVQEHFTKKLTALMQALTSAISAVASFILIYLNYDSLYTIMAYTGIMIALVCFIFFVLMRGEHRDTVFSKLISSLIFSSAICTVMSIGVSLCIWAFESLIFSWNDSYKIYSVANLLIWAVGYVNIFLSCIPKKDTSPTQSKIFKTFVLYAGLPLYILLIAILLGYLAKIVITQHMPVGEINWFASFASLFFIFFVLSVLQYNEKLPKLFVKFGGYFLIPVLIMQAIAVFERINAYGLTTPRTISLVLILISILFIGAAIIKPKHLPIIALASGIIVLLVTVTPFNVIDMPIASQTAILENALLKNDMLKDGLVIPNENISNEDKEIIRSAYHYLRYNAEKAPDFNPDFTKSFAELFGFESNGYDAKREHYSFYTKNSVDISEYDRMVAIDAYTNGIIPIEHNGEQYEINVKEIALQLYNQYGESQADMEPYQLNEHIALYFEHCSVSLENEAIEYCNIDGYALIKD